MANRRRFVLTVVVHYTQMCQWRVVAVAILSGIVWLVMRLWEKQPQGIRFREEHKSYGSYRAYETYSS